MSMANDVINDLGGATNAKIVDGVDSKVPEGWYMIALRTTKNPEKEYKNMVLGALLDFHFMRKDNGVWRQKRGLFINTLPNDKTPESENVWPAQYTSAIVYMIIRKEWSK